MYIERYADMAILEMKEFGIPASITLAQGILESGNGTSRLAVEGNNHFGIKCHGWGGVEIYGDDDQENECFRKYKNAKDSYRDHSNFLHKHSRYSFLFDIDITDYKAWARGLKKAGYATSPTYAEKLINLIERYHLYKFDVEDNSFHKKKMFITHSYGFPFLHGVGLRYLSEDTYFISADISSSFVFSGVSLGGGKRVFDRMYAAVSVSGIYHTYTDGNTHKFDIGLNPEIVYVLDKKNKKVFINAGFLYTFEEIKNRNMIPTFSLSYLIK